MAAPTTSLPEEPGGVRNWDYRFCWLRDSTLTLGALLSAGYLEEAEAWRDWLLRAVAGNPADLQIMYGLAGERRLPEFELPWLSGFAGSTPVRVGNDAVNQLQLDVYGEVMDSLSLARLAGMHPQPQMWELQCALMDFLATAWREPDEGLWEVRGGRRQFVHSKVMTWVALDRAVRTLEEHPELTGGDPDRWRALRDEVHREVCEKGYDPERNTFTQSYGSRELDASLLLIPRVGFLPPDDPRVVGTVDAIGAELSGTGSCAATAPRGTPSTGCRAARGRSWSARSGTRTRCTRRAGPRRPGSCSSGWWGSPTTWGCSPRSTTRWPATSSATSAGVQSHRTGEHGPRPVRGRGGRIGPWILD